MQPQSSRKGPEGRHKTPTRQLPQLREALALPEAGKACGTTHTLSRTSDAGKEPRCPGLTKDWCLSTKALTEEQQEDKGPTELWATAPRGDSQKHRPTARVHLGCRTFQARQLSLPPAALCLAPALTLRSSSSTETSGKRCDHPHQVGTPPRVRPGVLGHPAGAPGPSAPGQHHCEGGPVSPGAPTRLPPAARRTPRPSSQAASLLSAVQGPGAPHLPACLVALLGSRTLPAPFLKTFLYCGTTRMT